MEYKVLIKLLVPEIEDTYEAYIPINKTVAEVSQLLNQLVNNRSDGVYPIKESIHLYDRYTGTPYNMGMLVRDTNIRNGSELVFIS